MSRCAPFQSRVTEKCASTGRSPLSRATSLERGSLRGVYGYAEPSPERGLWTSTAVRGHRQDNGQQTSSRARPWGGREAVPHEFPVPLCAGNPDFAPDEAPSRGTSLATRTVVG